MKIENFKSFINEEITDFSPKINLILGKNGQGKSNFYSGLIKSNKIRLNK